MRRYLPLSLFLLFAVSVIEVCAARERMGAAITDLASGVSSQRTPGDDNPETIRMHLENGLEVRVHPLPKALVANVHLVFRAPAVSDSGNEPGLLHAIAAMLPLLETRHLMDAERTRLLAAADTWLLRPTADAGNDTVELAVAVPTEALELALFIEADRFFFAADGLTQTFVDAVLGAKSQSREVTEFHRLMSSGSFPESVFPDERPRALAPAKLEVDQVRRNLLWLLRPANTTLIVSGNIDAKATLDDIQRFFGEGCVSMRPSPANVGAMGRGHGRECMDTSAFYRPPQLAPRRPREFPATLTERISNAGTLRFIEDRTRPTVRMKVRFVMDNEVAMPRVAGEVIAHALESIHDRSQFGSMLSTGERASAVAFAQSHGAGFEVISAPENMAGVLGSVRESLDRAARASGNSWQTIGDCAKWYVGLVGPVSPAQAREFARAWQPSVVRRPSLVRCGKRNLQAPRVILVDEPERHDISVRARWPITRSVVSRSLARAVQALTIGARKLGNVNAARPSNPTTQFAASLESDGTGDYLGVDLENLGFTQLGSKLRELDGYFARLVERSDFAQMLRLGSHAIERSVVMTASTQAGLLQLLDSSALRGLSDPFDELQRLGLVERDSLGRFAEKLELSRAQLVIQGPAEPLRSELREILSPNTAIVTSPHAPSGLDVDVGGTTAEPSMRQSVQEPSSEPSSRFAWSIRAFPRAAISIAWPNRGIQFGAKEMHEDRAILAQGVRLTGTDQRTLSMRVFEITRTLQGLPVEERLALLPRWLAELDVRGARQPIDFHGAPTLETRGLVDKQFTRNRLVAAKHEVVLLTVSANQAAALEDADSTRFFDSLQVFESE